MKEHHSRERVALYLPSLGGGGAERVATILANFFCQSNLQVDVILATGGGVFRSNLREEINLIELNRKRTLASFWPLVKYLRRAQPTAVLAVMTDANIIAVAAKIFSGQKFRLLLSEHQNFTEVHRKSSNLSLFGYKLLIGLLYKHADAVIAVSEGVAQQFRAIFRQLGPKIIAIHNPVEIEAVQSDARQGVQRPRINIVSKSKIPVIVAAGRLEPPKDHATFIRALALLRKTQPFQALIFGQGSLEDELKSLIEELGLGRTVELKGFEKNIPAVLSVADCFVVSSRFEGFGVVLVEALAVGCPVVSTDCDFGPREILDGGRYGLLVTPGKPELLAQALKNSLESEPSPATLIRRARDFDISVIGPQYLRVLKAQSESPVGPV